MKIKEIISEMRNDFYARYECEHCGHVTEKQSGYHDNYFHTCVVPAKHCANCGLNRAGETEEVAKSRVMNATMSVVKLDRMHQE